eukprot:CAMPEP_0184304406 /NCGR_PEP_ID=MMETSP1049-20130417/13928_1 /TAXON_ID=77928 /ORGANISM="Proteomonas sulcata, Strain CCMP704" /LENGTH=91 /DNA_ID=CAMNT_0026616203 /DNA_START=320 /DNA_END=592 /DNA_ORIENTATION=+
MAKGPKRPKVQGTQEGQRVLSLRGQKGLGPKLKKQLSFFPFRWFRVWYRWGFRSSGGPELRAEPEPEGPKWSRGLGILGPGGSGSGAKAQE